MFKKLVPVLNNEACTRSCKVDKFYIAEIKSIAIISDCVTILFENKQSFNNNKQPLR